MNIGDVMFELHGTTGTLQVDAKKEAEAAGTAAAMSFSASFGGKLKTSLGSVLSAGFALEIGKQAVHGLETAFGDLVGLIPGMISEGKSWADTIEEIMTRTGATAEETSRLAGSLEYLGISSNGLGMALKTLAVNAVDHTAKFEKLGISVRDANGEFLNGVQILDSLRHYISAAGASEVSTANASNLLGRSAGDLIKYLVLTDAEALALNQEMDALGVTIGEDAFNAVNALGHEQNLLNLAWQGLSNTLTTALVPILRQFIGAITGFVTEHGPEIRQFFVDITNYVVGFGSALLGTTFTPFQAQLDALAGSTGHVTLTFEDWARQNNLTLPTVQKVTGATKANTTAIDKQIASVDRMIASEKRRTDAATAAIDAQIAQLDLSEQQLAIDQRRHDLNEQLNAAQLDLEKAQKGGPGGVDAQAVSDALMKIADIKAQQAENERKLGVDAQRTALEDRKAEIEAKAKARDDELTALKATLDKQRQAIKASGGGQVSDNAAKLAQMHRDWETYKEGVIAVNKNMAERAQQIIAGDAAKGTGLGGSMSKAFADGKVAGEAFDKFITDTLLPDLQSVGAFFTGVADVAGQFAAVIGGIDKPALGLGLMILGVASGNVPLALAGAALFGLNSGGLLTPGQAPGQYGGRYGFLPGQGGSIGGSSGGGSFAPILPNMTGAPSVVVVPSRQVMGATGGITGQPTIIRLEIGGRALLDYVDANLVYRRAT